MSNKALSFQEIKKMSKEDIMKEAQLKIDRSCIKIIMSPKLVFWSGLLMQVGKYLTKLDESSLDGSSNKYVGETAYTDGKDVYINPVFALTLEEEEMVFLILHELMHIIRKDTIRVSRVSGESRNPRIWNIAADAVINELLTEMSKNLSFIKPIKEGVYPEGELEPLKGQSSEWNYEWLVKKYGQEQEGQSSGCGDENEDGNGESQGEQGNGDSSQNESNSQSDKMPKSFDDLKPMKTKTEVEETESHVKRIVSAANTLSKEKGEDLMAGQGPSWLREIMIDILKPKVNWRQVLMDYMLAQANEDWSWRKPNSSVLVTTGCFAPSLNPEPSIGRVAILLDSSSSVNDDLLAEAWSEIKGMAHFIDNLDIYHFTTTIDASQSFDFKAGDIPENIIPTKRFEGGTSIPSSLENLMDIYQQDPEKEADVVIILSDMYSDMPSKALLEKMRANNMSDNVVWARLGENDKFEAPNGKEIVIF